MKIPDQEITVTATTRTRDRDRSAILRMAGNIACGLAQAAEMGAFAMSDATIATRALAIAREIVRLVDEES